MWHWSMAYEIGLWHAVSCCFCVFKAKAALCEERGFVNRILVNGDVTTEFRFGVAHRRDGARVLQHTAP